MFSAGVYVQASEKLASQSILGQHAANGVLNKALRMFFTDRSGRVLTLAAWITRVSIDNAVRFFLTGQSYFLSIDHNYVITAIHIRRIACLMLSADNVGDLAGHTTQHLRIGIHHYPAFFNRSLVGVDCFIAIMIHFYVLIIQRKHYTPSKRDTKVNCHRRKCKEQAEIGLSILPVQSGAPQPVFLKKNHIQPIKPPFSPKFTAISWIQA